MIYAKPRIRPRKRDAEMFWDFEIQTDRLILAKISDLVIVNKKDDLPNIGLRRSGWPQSKIERKRKKKKDKYLDLAREMKKKKHNGI